MYACIGRNEETDETESQRDGESGREDVEEEE